MSNDSNISPNWGGYSSLWTIIAIILAILTLLSFIFGCHPWSDGCKKDDSEFTNRISLLEKENAEIAGLKSNIVDLTAKSSMVAGLKDQIAALTVTSNKVPNLQATIKSLQAANSGDNSALTARIAELEGEVETGNGMMSGLRAKVKALEAVDINFVKPVDDTALLAQISELKAKTGMIPGLQAKIKALEGVDYSFTTKPADNSALLARISELETKNGLIPGLKAKIKALESIDINFLRPSAAMSSTAAAKLYFANNSATFPTDPDQSLESIIRHLKANPSDRASIVGYHSSTGSAEWNNQLASNRSDHVRDLMLNAGITANRIVVEKPLQTLGSGSSREARRVEVSIIESN